MHTYFRSKFKSLINLKKICLKKFLKKIILKFIIYIKFLYISIQFRLIFADIPQERLNILENFRKEIETFFKGLNLYIMLIITSLFLCG